MPAPEQLPEDLREFRESYEELIGFVPPRVAARFEITADVAPEFLRLQEELRASAMYSDVFDVKTTQLLLFGILLGLMGDAARLHAIAARRAGASWEELHKVVELAFLFRGMPAMNLGCEILAAMRREEEA
jgi:4-carboxymuconolactone decarboxylase